MGRSSELWKVAFLFIAFLCSFERVTGTLIFQGFIVCRLALESDVIKGSLMQKCFVWVTQHFLLIQIKNCSVFGEIHTFDKWEIWQQWTCIPTWEQFAWLSRNCPFWQVGTLHFASVSAPPYCGLKPTLFLPGPLDPWVCDLVPHSPASIKYFREAQMSHT